MISGSYHVGVLTTSDPNILGGTTIIDANATLWVTDLFQDTVIVSGTLVLGGGPSTGGGVFAPAIPAGDLRTGGPSPAPQPAPEPASLVLLALGGLAVLRRRR